MVKIHSCAFALSMLMALPVYAQDTTADELPPPSKITEAQKTQAQQNINQNIDTLVNTREPQQMKRILKASEQIEKNKIRQKNRFAPAGEQVRYQEKNINAKDKNALKKYFTETYVTDPSIVEPATTEPKTEAK